jgi:hypothetical protein
VNESFLVGLTSLGNFLFLITSLWVGLYVLLRGPKDKASWLVSATLWSLSGYFLNTLISIHSLPGEGALPWWWGWSVAISVPFWFHVSVALLPRKLAGRQQTLVVLFYLLALNLIAMEAYTPFIFRAAGDPSQTRYGYQLPGRLFWLYGLFLLLGPGLSLWNFRKSAELTPNALLRRQFALLQGASLLAAAAAIYSSLSIWLQLSTPTLISALLLGCGSMLLAYGVARWNALAKGRFLGGDFQYAAAAAGLVVGAYLLVAVISNLAFDAPFIAYVFLICFAMITHPLYDFGLGILDRYFSSRRRQATFRSNLRDLARNPHVQEDLQSGLKTMLDSLCQALGVDQAWIALCGGEELVTTGITVGEIRERYRSLAELAKDEARILEKREAPYAEGFIVAPLLYSDARFGAIAMIPGSGAAMFSEAELDLIDGFADRVAEVLHTSVLQEDAVSQIGAMALQFKRRETDLRSQMRMAMEGRVKKPITEGWEAAEFYELVEKALQNMGDYSYLGRHELAHLKAVSRIMDCMELDHVTHLDRGKALCALLTTCIDKLRPSDPRPVPPTPEWRSYIILHDCYISGIQTRGAMSELYISEATFHRARRRAVRAVARAISEMEQAPDAALNAPD